METLIVILVGILVTIGTYLILSRQLLRIVLGSSLISHAVNLLLITSGGLKPEVPSLKGAFICFYRCNSTSVNFNSDCY